MQSLNEVEEESIDETAGLVNASREDIDAVVVYKRRWLILSVFCLNTMMNATMFITFGSINDILCKYYNVGSGAIDWTANIFLVTYIFIALPSAFVMSNYGLRPLLLVGSSLHAIAASLHYAGSGRNGFGLIMAGQVSAAVAVGAILQVPARLASVWFSEHERATATSLAVAMNIFGVAVGFLQPTKTVHDSISATSVEADLKVLYVSQLAACGLVLLLTYLFFEEAPPSPPSASQSLTTSKSHLVSPGFLLSLKMIGIDKDFHLIAHSYGIYFGVLSVLSISLNQMVTRTFTEGFDSRIGWMGFGCQIAGMISTASLGVLLDRYRCFRAVAILLNLGCVLLVTAFVLVLTQTKIVSLVMVLYVAIGIVAIPFFSSGMEHVAEITFPVPEGTSSAVLLMLGSTYGFVFVYCFGLLIRNGAVRLTGYIMIGLYFVAMLLASSATTRLKRQEADYSVKVLKNPETQAFQSSLPKVS